MKMNYEVIITETRRYTLLNCKTKDEAHDRALNNHICFPERGRQIDKLKIDKAQELPNGNKSL